MIFRQHGWLIALCWLLPGMVAAMVGYALMKMMYDLLWILALPVAWGASLAVVTLLQWAILASATRKGLWEWPLATLCGYCAASVASGISGYALAQLLNTGENKTSLYAVVIIVPATFRAIVAVAQAGALVSALNLSLDRAMLWILNNVLAGIVLGLALALTDMFAPDAWATQILAVLLAEAGVGVITGPILAWIVQHPADQRTAHV